MTQPADDARRQLASRLDMLAHICHGQVQRARAEENVTALSGALRAAIGVNETSKDIMASPKEILEAIKQTLEAGGLTQSIGTQNRHIDALIRDTNRNRDASSLAAALERIIVLCEKAVEAATHDNVRQFPMASDLVRAVREALHDTIL